MTALRRNGDEFPVDMSISAVKKGGSYEFNAFIADTSERKKKEDWLGELTNRLRESEALYRLLTEDALDVIWKTDCDLHLTYVSPADERLRGFRADELIGRHVFEMFAEESVKEVEKIVSQSRKAEQPGAQAGFFTFSVQHRSKDGRLIWGEVLSKPERDEQGFITGHHGITRDITDRKRLEEQVHQLAFYDPLTKLPNRRLLNDRLSQTMTASKRSGRFGALMFIDLDNFKPLNDTHGHVVGDLLLVEVAVRLTACVREVDTVSRFGGDEFVVLLSDLNLDEGESMAESSHVAEKIRTTLATPYLLTASHEGETANTVNHRCSASIGVALFNGNDVSQNDVFKRADAAMYQAKEAGRNLYRIYGVSA
jgi:diguanylate cyclase (GGDEF)-like protein/PAS domain S-box-containing protein